jgi:hypothetical protein
VTIRRARSPFGMILVSVARKARSVQDMRGLRFVRRSTATSCRSASISTSLADEDRASNASQDSTVTSSRYASATHMGAEHVGVVAPGQTSGLVFDHYRHLPGLGPDWLGIAVRDPVTSGAFARSIREVPT